MSKKIIITESQLQHTMSSLLSEELDKDDVVEMFKKNKDFEKTVRELKNELMGTLYYWELLINKEVQNVGY